PKQKDALNNSGRPVIKSYNGDYCKEDCRQTDLFKVVGG
ncbi:hypothetical protein A2U01_0094325, partial [Trifolium medium]|nr:hypothetical protein [Trifolium medium]